MWENGLGDTKITVKIFVEMGGSSERAMHFPEIPSDPINHQ